MMEQVFAANPALEQAFEAGVEVELGVYCWGAWVPGYGLASLPEPLAGLADEERSWMVGFERLIIATGARDVAFSFKGWDQPGVMGARALQALLRRLRRLRRPPDRRFSAPANSATANRALALARGSEVAALIDIADAAQAPADAVARLIAAGVEILTVPRAGAGGGHSERRGTPDRSRSSPRAWNGRSIATPSSRRSA